MNMGELVMKCLHARTAAHVLHLKSRSYAQHIALKDFYDTLVELVDKLAETYQGDYGLIEEYSSRFVMADDAVQLVSGLAAWIEAHREHVCDEDDTYLQNILDEIVALCRSTTYKLKFLK